MKLLDSLISDIFFIAELSVSMDTAFLSAEFSPDGNGPGNNW